MFKHHADLSIFNENNNVIKYMNKLKVIPFVFQFYIVDAHWGVNFQKKMLPFREIISNECLTETICVDQSPKGISHEKCIPANPFFKHSTWLSIIEPAKTNIFREKQQAQSNKNPNE